MVGITRPRTHMRTAILVVAIAAVAAGSAVAINGPTAAAQSPQPSFNLHVYDDAVFTFDWPGPATITVSIDDPTNGPGIDFTTSETGPADTGLFISFVDQFDVKPGHIVEVTDGTTTLSHIVQLVTITELDPAADRIAGMADPGAEVDIGIGGPEVGVVPFQQFVTADQSGFWEVDLTNDYDLLDGAWIAAHRVQNGNTSMFVLDPSFSVFVPSFVHTWGWLPGIEITLTIDDPGTSTSPDFETAATSPPSGRGFGFDLHGLHEVHRGDVVSMSDGSSNVIHVVRDLYLTQADLATGVVEGTADPGTEVEARVYTDSDSFSELATVDPAGNWTAGPFPELQYVEAAQYDVVGNSTVITGPLATVFDGHDYTLYQDARSWHDAVAFCKSQGRHLVTIGSAAENAFVFDLSPGTWLGATDELVEGDWQWVTGEPFSYTNWAPGEPNNRDGSPPHGPEHYLSFAFPFDGTWNDIPIHSMLPFICEEGRTVDVDIRPGSDTNPVNLKARVVPVAVLTTSDFDATTIDPLSVAFGPLGAVETHNRGHLADVDDDGDIDLGLHFTISETGIEAGDTEACVAALTVDGEPVSGCDIVTVLD